MRFCKPKTDTKDSREGKLIMSKNMKKSEMFRQRQKVTTAHWESVHPLVYVAANLECQLV